MNKTGKDGLPILICTSQKEWEQWLEKNHNSAPGVWVRIYKKDSGKKSITYDEALDEALCYGWIDGLLNKDEEASYLLRFTPRRSKSIWSKRNTEHIKRLIRLGKMKPSGLKQVTAAKADGRWQGAYESAGSMTMPEEFLKQLSRNAKAKAFFETLNRSNQYAIFWRVTTAKKEETRQRRIHAIIQMLSEEKSFH